jgi:16S rRNA (adenine1518-N6/adenine1519-N6)-dimethyltransferase
LPRNVELIHADALKIDFATLPKFNKIVSNLPFQISSPITFKFLDHDFETAVLIYQKEFADRMIAKPGSKNYSRLSVGIYYRTHCKLLETVIKTLFRPQPKVDSCMIQLTPRNSPPFSVVNEPFYFDMVNKLFSHRRKKIETTLRKTYGNLNKDIPYLNKRVGELTPEQMGELSNILFEL